MDSLNRRDFLRWSTASLTALGYLGMPPFLRRSLAQPMTRGKKLLFIFLRGGIDGVQAVIPFGDAGLPGKKSYLQARPTLGIQPADAHDLNGFVSLHPTLHSLAGGPRVLDIFRGALDGRLPGLAICHRVGYESQNRSHFSSQQFWENGVPGAVNLEQGVFNRYLTQYLQGSTLPAATLATNQMVMLKGQTLVPTLRTVDDYALPSNVPIGAPATPSDPLGSGLLGSYTQQSNPAIRYDPLAYSTGQTLLSSLQFFESTVRKSPYLPEADAQPFYDAIGDQRFGGFVRDCARLLKQLPDIQIVGCNQDGYDTHGNENARLPSLLGDLGNALTALYFDLKPIWDDVVVMTMSEFGRTSEENGNRGTDHGESTVMFLMGGPVKGGVYNADPTRWSNGDLFSTPNGRYLAHRTDYRAVYHEVLTRHLGDPANRMDLVIPGYSGYAAQDPNGYFKKLGILPG